MSPLSVAVFYQWAPELLQSGLLTNSPTSIACTFKLLNSVCVILLTRDFLLLQNNIKICYKLTGVRLLMFQFRCNFHTNKPNGSILTVNIEPFEPLRRFVLHVQNVSKISFDLLLHMSRNVTKVSSDVRNKQN